jgi:hypothetical protein
MLEQERGKPFFVWSALGLLSPLLAAGLIAVLFVVALLPALRGGSRPEPAPQAAAAARAEALRERIAAGLVFTAPPAPSLPRVWVVDVAGGTVGTLASTRPEPFVATYAAWLGEDGSSVIQIGVEFGVVSPDGQVRNLFGHDISIPRFQSRVRALAGGERLVLWREDSGELFLYEVAANAAQVLAVFGRPTGWTDSDTIRESAFSRDGRLLAFTDPRPDGIDLVMVETQRPERTVVYARDDASARLGGLAWSPDGSFLLFKEGYYGPLAGGAGRYLHWQDFVVVDRAGEVVWRLRSDSTSDVWWAGVGRLLIIQREGAPNIPPGAPAQRAFYLDLASRRVSGAAALPWGTLTCVSPSGRLGLFSRASDPAGPISVSVRELATGAVVAEGLTADRLGGCDWSAEESRVLLSYWGG